MWRLSLDIFGKRAFLSLPICHCAGLNLRGAGLRDRHVTSQWPIVFRPQSGLPGLPEPGEDWRFHPKIEFNHSSGWSGAAYRPNLMTENDPEGRARGGWLGILHKDWVRERHHSRAPAFWRIPEAQLSIPLPNHGSQLGGFC